LISGGGGAGSTSRKRRSLGRGGLDFSVAGACGEERRTGEDDCSGVSPGTGMARSTSSAMTSAAFISATSWTLTMWAPASTAAVTAAAVAYLVSSSLLVAEVRNDLRDGPTRIGYSSFARSASRAMISAFCSLRLPKPRPGSRTIEMRSTPARRARLMEASRSLVTASMTSGMGPSLPQVSGVPRMWLRINPASF
jgi:hypothetical protein